MSYREWIVRSSRTMTRNIDLTKKSSSGLTHKSSSGLTGGSTWNNAGFTLAEVLVFMTAGFLVVSAAYALYHVGQASFTSGLAVAEINQNARVAISHLKGTINRAEPYLYGWYARSNGLNCIAGGNTWKTEAPDGTVIDGSLIKQSALKSMWTDSNAVRDAFKQTWVTDKWNPELDDNGNLESGWSWIWPEEEVNTGWYTFASWGNDIQLGGKTTWENWWDNGLSAWKQFGEDAFEDNFWATEVWDQHFPKLPGFQWSNFGVAAQNGLVFYSYTGSTTDGDTHYFNGDAYYFTQEAYFSATSPPTLGKLYHYVMSCTLASDGTVTGTAPKECLLADKLAGCTFSYISLSGQPVTMEDDGWKPLPPDGIGYVKIDLNFFDFNDANGDGKQDESAKHLEETRASLDIHLFIQMQNITDL